MVKRMKEFNVEQEAFLKKAAEDMKRFYDAGRRPEEFQIGDRVWLSTKNLSTERPSKKLEAKRIGPFEIIKKIGPLTYKLKLPKSMKIHPVVSVAWLEKANDDEWERPRPKVTLKVRDPQSGDYINQIQTIEDDDDAFSDRNKIDWSMPLDNPSYKPRKVKIGDTWFTLL